jgi:hypothetical protein
MTADLKVRPVLRHACMADADRLYPPETVFEDCPVCWTLLSTSDKEWVRLRGLEGRLRELIAKWRQRKEQMVAGRTDIYGQALLTCADEVEALLVEDEGER